MMIFKIRFHSVGIGCLRILHQLDALRSRDVIAEQVEHSVTVPVIVEIPAGTRHIIIDGEGICLASFQFFAVRQRDRHKLCRGIANLGLVGVL